MAKKLISVVFVVVALLSVVASQAQAALIKINAQNDVFGAYSNAVSDDNGGSYIGWINTDSGFEGMYIQHFDSNGNELWTSGGQKVGNVYTDLTSHPEVSYPEVELVPDGSGGVIAAWIDDRSGSADADFNIYVQRYDSDGNALWTTPPDPLDGVALSPIEGRFQTTQYSFMGKPDGTGGVYFVFSEGTLFGDVYIQRFDASGTRQYGGGIDYGISVASGAYFNADVDASGNLLLAFSGSGYVYTQKYDLDGNELWSVGGEILGDGSGTRDVHGLAEDGSGGAMIMYYQYNGAGDRDLYVQHYDTDGVAQLSGDGVVVATYNTAALSDAPRAHMNRDGNYYFLMYETLDDGNSNNAVYVQKIDADANQLWTSGGIEVGDNNEGYREFIASIPDGDGGMFAAIFAAYNSTYSDSSTYVTHFDSDGTEWPVPKNMATSSSYWQFSFGSVAEGEVVFVWPEDVEGTQAAYWARISNVYQIDGLTDLDVQDTTDSSFKAGTTYGVRGTAVETTLIDSSSTRPVSLIEVDMSTDRSWSSVTAGVDETNRKAFVSSLTSEPGADSSHTLYIPYSSGDGSVVICPNATSLSEVAADCVGAIEKYESDSDVSIQTIDGYQVWAVTGLTGTGGVGVPETPSGSSGLTQGLSGSVSVDMISPKDFTNDARPTLVFKKAQLSENAVSSYEVILDPGRNRSFSVSGLPASHSSESSSVWRDDTHVRVTYHNEQDSDPTNDEIHVFFKGLESEPLSEGEHGWRVVVTNNNNQYQEYNQGFKLDTTAPKLSSWNVTNQTAAAVEKTYYLALNQKPSFSGQISDEYQGGEVTYANNSKDNFTKVAAGPRVVKIYLDQLSAGLLGTPLAVYSSFDQFEVDVETQTDVADQYKRGAFTLTANKSLAAGGYRVRVVTVDSVGNSRDAETIFVSVGRTTPITFKDITDAVIHPLATLESSIIETSVMPSPSTKDPESVLTKVTVTVVDDEGRPVAGAKVGLSNGQEVVTDGQGMAVFNDVRSAQYVVTITSESGVASQSIQVKLGMETQSFTIQLGEKKAPPPIGVAGLRLLPQTGDGVLGVAVPYAAALAGVALPAAGFLVLLSSYGSAVNTNLIWKLLQALGLLAKNQPQGLVFETSQHSPVPFALLTVRSQAGAANQPALTETLVSDVDGIYQGISLPAGTYTIEAAHQEYRFPARPAPVPYLTMKEFYRGEPFQVLSAKARQFFLVPLDPLAKTSVNVWLAITNKVKVLFSKLNLINFGLPMALLSLYVAITYPSILNWGIVLIYAVLMFRALPNAFKQPIITGQVLDDKKQPLQNVVVRLSSPDGNSFTAIVTSDAKGRFKLYGPKSKYQINLFKPGFEWQHDGSPMSFEEIDSRYQLKNVEVHMKPVTPVDMSQVSIKTYAQ